MLVPRENSSLLDAQTTQDHPQTHPYTRVLISQSPRFFLLITIRKTAFACKRPSEATLARPWASSARPDSRRRPSAGSAHQIRSLPRPSTVASTITAAPELEICAHRAPAGRPREAAEGLWALIPSPGGGGARSERPQAARMDPPRCRLGKPTPREAGDARKPPAPASRRGSRRQP